MVFYEEYARAGGPGRVGIVNEGLIGPTIVHFGDDAQRAKFLPGILAGTEIWCQGYSEPNAGSDLANLSTRAVRDGDDWVITGQKVWTSLAHWAQWCFVLCRTDLDAPRHRGISYVLCPMGQPGIEIRPIVQITGNSEFNEVFFDGARAPVADTIGGPEGGWKVAMGTLAFERGASTLGQQLAFENELVAITEAARANGTACDATVRQRLAGAWATLRIMRYHALRSLSVLEAGAVDRAERDPQAVLGELPPRARRARRRRARRRRHGRDHRRRLPRGLPAVDGAASVPLLAAPTPSTAAATRSNAT